MNSLKSTIGSRLPRELATPSSQGSERGTGVIGGTLVISNSLALGGTSAGTTIQNGATMRLQGGLAVGVEALSLTGTGAAGAGERPSW